MEHNEITFTYSLAAITQQQNNKHPYLFGGSWVIVLQLVKSIIATAGTS